MKIKNILPSMVMVLLTLMHGRSGAVGNQLPTLKNASAMEKEVINTRNPLTIVLYGSLMKYLKCPSVPQSSTLNDCMRRHELLKTPWVHEKGFPQDISDASQKGSSEQEIMGIIESNPSYQGVPKITQQLLKINLNQARKDCLKEVSDIE